MRCGVTAGIFSQPQAIFVDDKITSHNSLYPAGDFIVDERRDQLVYVSFTSVFILMSQQELIRI